MSSILSAPSALRIRDGVAMIVGLVMGAGIFKTPSLVAANSGSVGGAVALWLAGGVISLLGALCYAELASSYPHRGGEYHFLKRAFGRNLAFLFAWARLGVIQTGSIAMVSFILGDYASQIFPLGPYSSSLYAALAIMTLTAFNIAGLRTGARVQNTLTAFVVMGLLCLTAAGLWSSPVFSSGTILEAGAAPFPAKALVFVMLTYGGWNEAAYLSAEVDQSRKAIVKVLLLSIGVITMVYVLTNFALLRGLGLREASGSDAVAADLMNRVLGPLGAAFVSLLVALAALTTANGSIVTGGRSSFAMGRDFRVFRFLGHWKTERQAPVVALLTQGGIALALIGFGTQTRDGFVAMVEYTAPVFWFFFLLLGVSIFVLRMKDGKTKRPFLVPFYPVTPLAFCAACFFMLYSSLAYSGKGALLGVLMLLTGVPVLFLNQMIIKKEKRNMKLNLTKAALVLMGFVGTSLAKDVPYVPTPEPVVQEMLRMANVTEQDVLYDLGCGDGRIVITAAKERGARGVGIDIDPERVRESREKAEEAGVSNRVRFLNQDLFSAKIDEASVVTLYLLPRVNLALRPKLLSDLKPGTRIVSHDFDMGEWKPDQTKRMEGSVVHFWRVPANASGEWMIEIPGHQGKETAQGMLKISQQFQVLSGALEIDGQSLPVTEAAVRGEQLEFVAAPYRFEGRVLGDRMEGEMHSIAAQGSVQPFNAQRRTGSDTKLTRQSENIP